MIRQMQEKDLDEIILIENELFTSPWNKEQFVYEINENEFSRSFVLEIDNEIIAYGMMWFLFENADITNIAVKKKYQKQGYGLKMLKHLIKEAINNNCEFIHLEVRINNKEAINLYNKMGFETVRIRKHYYEDGSDAYDMIKAIGGLSEKDFSD